MCGSVSFFLLLLNIFVVLVHLMALRLILFERYLITLERCDCVFFVTLADTLLVARHGDVSSKLNQAFLLVDSFNLHFVDEERSDIWRTNGLF